MTFPFLAVKSKKLKTLIIALMLITLSTSKLYSQIYIEAENYTKMSGIETEVTSDEGGGLNVGWIDNNDWMEYNVSIPISGDYNISMRAAGEIGGKVKITDDGTEMEIITIPSTGGWQIWTTTIAENSIHLDEGEHTLRLIASPGGFNLNWFKIFLTNPIDNNAPSAPIIINSNISAHNIFLNWESSVDENSMVAGYQIFMNNKFFKHTTDTSLNLSKLAPNTEFNISVVASDLSGNNSTSSSITVKTDTLPWEISWSDEFNYTGEVDRSKWNFQTGGDGWGNGEAQYYSDGNNASVANGVLTIEARQENHGTNKFTSTRMNSSGKGDFLFGRVEVRAKIPKTKGTWPAIWTLPTEWLYGSWPDCGEIDIMEHSATYGYGNVFGTIHTGAYNHVDGTQKSGGTTYNDVTDTFHTYTLEWYPDHLDWYYDDSIVFTFNNEYKTTAEWPFDIKHHLLLNMAIGGGLGGDINFAGEWPQQMIVDYVRVYDFKLGENDTIAPEAPTNLYTDAKWSSINLSWSPSRDNFAIAKYYIYLDVELIDSTKETSILLQNLESLNEYKLSIQAIDVSGNLSPMASIKASTTAISGITIPGKIEAENFTSMEGVDTENCTDAGGGDNVGWIDTNDWLTYTIDVKEAIEYRAAFRVAGENASSQIQLIDNIGAEITSIDFSVSGGWQSWKTVLSEPFMLPVGIYTIKVLISKGGFNLNWIDIKGKDDFVGISNSLLTPFLIYPNPLKGDQLTIEIPIDINKISVMIFATDGRILYNNEVETNINQVNINNLQLKPGVYFISIITNKLVFSQPLQIQY